MKQSRLNLETMSKEGDGVVLHGEVGLVKASIDCAVTGTSFISVDAFQGAGENYRRRENCEVIIRSRGKDVFVGTFEELVEKVSS